METTGSGFREAVRREIRDTWGRRWRLWLSLAFLVELGILMHYTSIPVSRGVPAFDPRLLLNWPSSPVACLAYSVPMWLCADLLARCGASGADPFVAIDPAVYRAKAVGRLTPALGVLAVWCGTYCWGELAAAHRGAQVFIPPLSGTLVEYALTGIAWWAASIFFALACAALGALLSAWPKRSRRWAVFGMGVVCLKYPAFLLQRNPEWEAGLTTIQLVTYYLQMVLLPPAQSHLELGLTWKLGPNWTFMSVQWNLAGISLATALVLAWAASEITVWRYRRARVREHSLLPAERLSGSRSRS